MHPGTHSNRVQTSAGKNLPSSFFSRPSFLEASSLHVPAWVIASSIGLPTKFSSTRHGKSFYKNNHLNECNLWLLSSLILSVRPKNPWSVNAIFLTMNKTISLKLFPIKIDRLVHQYESLNSLNSIEFFSRVEKANLNIYDCPPQLIRMVTYLCITVR